MLRVLSYIRKDLDEKRLGRVVEYKKAQDDPAERGSYSKKETYQRIRFTMSAKIHNRLTNQTPEESLSSILEKISSITFSASAMLYAIILRR